MLKYVCKICGQSFNHHIIFNNHLKESHKTSSKPYYDQYLKNENEGKCVICSKPTAYINFTKGYRECCSVGCANTQRARKTSETGNGSDVTCLICNEKLHSTGTIAHVYSKLFYHLNTVHGITSQKAYYDEYIKQENEGICPICGKETEFRSIGLGYNTYCSSKCSGDSYKNDENSAITTYKNIKDNKTFIDKIITAIKDKYKKFISGGDKLINYSDIRSDPVIRKNVSDTKTFIDPENTNNQITVKTEITCTPTNVWLPEQEYDIKTDFCQKTQYNWYNDIINDDQNLSSNEWC